MQSLTQKGRRAGWIAVLAVCIAPTACDTLSDPLEVQPASRIPAAQLETPGNAQLLSFGAIGDFECAFHSYAGVSGLVGEEFIYAQQNAAHTPYDRRNTTKDDQLYATGDCTEHGVYTTMQTARQSNENVLALLKSWSDADVAAGPGAPNRTNLMAIAAAYAGYAYVLLGEAFCTMAISSVNPDKTLTYGGEIQRDSVFRLAVARLSEAITLATAAGNTNIRTMAYLGRARAKLNLRDYAGARTDAQQVPSGYVLNASASDVEGRRQNQVATHNTINNDAFSVGEPYRSMGDARVPVTRSTRPPSATGIVHWYQTKYLTTATPIPIATYEEAQLIIAEADIRAGNLASALIIINASRARGGQPAYTGPLTQAALLAELIDQRRRELFAESHHLGDILRYNIAIQPAAGTPYHFGGVYSDQICLPLPSVERLNNPLIGS